MYLPLGAPAARDAPSTSRKLKVLVACNKYCSTTEQYMYLATVSITLQVLPPLLESLLSNKARDEQIVQLSKAFRGLACPAMWVTPG